MADTPDLGSGTERYGGSSPLLGTKIYRREPKGSLLCFWNPIQSEIFIIKLQREEHVRILLGVIITFVEAQGLAHLFVHLVILDLET